jgi:hypothetical protein
LAYRELWRRAEAGETQPFPLHLDLDITTRCNLSCPICPAGNPARSLFPGMGLDLSLSLAERALAEAAAGGLYSLRIGVTGEPLLRGECPDLIASARAQGILDLALITNGLLLTEKTARALIRAGLTRLMVSVDAGSAESYRAARPGGDFALVLKNIRAFLALRQELSGPLPLLRVSFVETRLNEGDKELFIATFAPLADYLSIQKYAPLTRGDDFAPEAFAPKAGATPEPQGPRRCPEPMTRLALHADGALFPCCSDFGRLRPLGRYPEISLKEAFNSPRAAFLREPRAGDGAGADCADCLRRLSAAFPAPRAFGERDGALQSPLDGPPDGPLAGPT